MEHQGSPQIWGKPLTIKVETKTGKEKKKKKEMEGHDWGSEHPDRLDNISECVCEDASG